MKIMTVIPLDKGVFKSDLTYFSAKDIKNGSIVNISVRNKKILGLVVSSQEVSNLKSNIKDMSFKLKKITEVKEHSIFKQEFIESALLMNSYFISSKSNNIALFIPVLFKEKYNDLEKFQNSISIIEKENSKKILENIKTEKLLFQANFEDRISYYKTLIRGNFAFKKSVFIILPTEYDLEVFYQSLAKGIENFTFSISGNLKPKKIIEQYEQIINSTHGVLILCTAQFLAIPRHDIGVIIVEHESSNIYKMISKPHFDLRIFAEIYASKIKAKFILGDTLLRFETIARKELENLSEIYPMSFRTNFNKIKISIIDSAINLEKNNQKTKFEVLKEESIDEITKKIENKKNVFIFSLRKGLATYTICKDCNTIITCENCMAPVVLYLSKDGKKRMFICNKCNTEKSPETVCALCGSWNLIPLGIGTETIFEEIKNKFPENKIFKIDKESVKTAKIAEKIIKEFDKNHGSILIGTEMAFFYLKEKVALSFMASFDSLWSIPNYKMSEKIIHLLLSILDKTEEKLIIQTKNKNDSALLAIKSENLLPFVREELNDRKNLNYPPYKRFIKITFVGDKNESLEAKKNLEELFKEYKPEIFNSFITKNKEKFTTNALIKINRENWSLPELSHNSSIDKNLFNLLYSLPPSFEVTVDPEDLL